MQNKKEIIERIAKAGFERMFDEQWKDLKDKDLWREIASDMLDILSVMKEEGEGKKKEWKGEKA